MKNKVKKKVQRTFRVYTYFYLIMCLRLRSGFLSINQQADFLKIPNSYKIENKNQIYSQDVFLHEKTKKKNRKDYRINYVTIF